jgi:hypothetical protein
MVNGKGSLWLMLSLMVGVDAGCCIPPDDVDARAGGTMLHVPVSVS